MGGPAGVPDPGRARRHAFRLDLPHELRDLVLVLDHRHGVVGLVHHRDARGVVAPVLETPQSVEQDGAGGAWAGVPDDAAHGLSLKRTAIQRGYGVAGALGLGVGVGAGVGRALITTVTVTVAGDAVTPGGGTRARVRVSLPVRPCNEMVLVEIESSALSRSWGPASTTDAGEALSPAR